MEDLIVRSFQESLTVEDRDRLRAWRDASTENETYYRSLARIWEVAGKLAPIPLHSPPPRLEDVLRAARPESESLPGDLEEPLAEPRGLEVPDA